MFIQAISTFILLKFLSEVIAEEEFLPFQLNPGCQKCNQSTSSILYAKASGKEGSLHYIWSINSNQNFPTLLLVRTSNASSEIKILWEKYLNVHLHGSQLYNAVKISPSQNISSAVIEVKKLYAYNDTSNTANLNDNADHIVKTLLFNDLKWKMSVSGDNKTAVFKATNLGSWFESSRSKIELRFRPHTSLERNEEPPQLLYTNTSSELSFIFDDLKLGSRNTLRIALELSFSALKQFNSSANLYENKTIELETSRSVSDEFSPLVFTTNQVRWKENVGGSGYLEDKNFLKWRTCAYTNSTDKSKHFVTDAVAFNLTETKVADIKSNRLLSAFYNGTLVSRSTVIMFGKIDDGYYSSTKYLKFTSVVGFGTAPVDGFSLAAFLILTLGLGVPCLIMIAFVLTLGILKNKNSSASVPISKHDVEPLIRT